jgi:hypothetical protein
MHNAAPAPALCCPCPVQVTKYVEREILNHRCLVHPHIVQFKEVCFKQLPEQPRGCRVATAACTRWAAVAAELTLQSWIVKQQQHQLDCSCVTN